MSRINFPKVRQIVVGILFIAISFSAGYGIGIKGFLVNISDLPHVHITRDVPISDLDFSLFWRVWDNLNTSYFDKSKLVPANMVYGAISGMVSAIGDPYTVFLPPSENKITEDDLHGNFEGVGIQIGYRGNNLAVMAPLPGSPAEKAGVKAGDLIVGIKDPVQKIDHGTAGITLPQAVKEIRGTAGTTVTLALTREGVDKPIILDIVRAGINVPSVEVSYVGDQKDVAYLKILKFGAETKDEWNKSVTDILAHPNLSGIVLDLRNNPGGYLQSAVDIASDFVDTNSVVVAEQKVSGEKEEIKTQLVGRLTNQKVVVLVNKGSASASEILAGALRDIKYVKLVGDTTFGKGTVQEPEQLENGAGLHVTVAKWLTPSGVWVNEKGLEPDVKIKEDPNNKDDVQLLKAIETLKS